VLKTLAGLEEEDAEAEERSPSAAVEPFPSAGERKGARVLQALLARLEAALRALRDLAEGMGWLPAAFLLLGLFAWRDAGSAGGHEGWLARLYLLLPAAAMVVVLSGLQLSSGYLGRRHLYPAGAVLVGLSGLGLLALGRALARLRPGSRRAARAPVVLASLVVLAMVPRSTGLLARPDREAWTREAGLSLRGAVPPAETVLAAGETARAAFYAGARVVMAGGGAPLRRLARRAAREGARWIFIDAAAASPLPDPPGGWALERRFPHGAGELRVYRSLPPAGGR
jgi:hypothetical protein